MVWGILNKDEHVLGELPYSVDEPAAEDTFLHFLQQGNLSDDALLAFDPEALEIMQSMRAFKKQQDESEALVLTEWHAEWVQSEQHQQTSPESMNSSLLMQPAGINLRSHTAKAKRASLDYYGNDSEAPDGTLHQKEQQAQDAKRRRSKQHGRLDVDNLLSSVPSSRDDAGPKKSKKAKH